MYIYTYKTYETPLLDSVHNSKKKQLHTYVPTLWEQVSRFYVLWFLCNVRSNFTEEIQFQEFMMKNPI